MGQGHLAHAGPRRRFGPRARADVQRVAGGALPPAAPGPGYPRLHLDLVVDTTAEQETEIRRLIELGATELDWDRYPPNPDFVVLADPDGNPFCVVDLSVAPSG
ncbi:VOC family protein [Amycolatopsis magusensis]|uniref:VOC family protein n=1 Tax=Amycolatopsis magusensis TaxID=882444 RepID=UPI0024A892EB|nr:VOC family protein [Amycolatopsis magusensis]MDI5982144.1 VOC family protein [Amycolatopsis magusensis]